MPYTHSSLRFPSHVKIIKYYIFLLRHKLQLTFTKSYCTWASGFTVLAYVFAESIILYIQVTIGSVYK